MRESPSAERRWVLRQGVPRVGVPVGGFTSVVASVLHPYLSDYRDRPGEIYARFVDLTRAMFAVGIIMSACLVAAPGEVVAVLFGDRWGDAAPLLRALGASVMFQMVTSLTGAVFQSLGATREMFWPAVPLLAKAGACCACYAALLAATGQWRHLRAILGRG